MWLSTSTQSDLPSGNLPEAHTTSCLSPLPASAAFLPSEVPHSTCVHWPVYPDPSTHSVQTSSLIGICPRLLWKQTHPQFCKYKHNLMTHPVKSCGLMEMSVCQVLLGPGTRRLRSGHLSVWFPRRSGTLDSSTLTSCSLCRSDSTTSLFPES